LNDVLLIILVIIALIVWIIIGPNWLVFRAMKKVIKALKKRDAYNAKNACYAEEIGIRKQTMFSNMFKVRDYRPQALQQLVQLEIVKQTDDEKFYINQEKLDQSRLKNC